MHLILILSTEILSMFIYICVSDIESISFQFMTGQSSGLLQQHGLNAFLQILRDSISNRTSCVRAEMLNFLLDWFALEDDDGVVVKIALLVQVIGGHSISGKDIRKIFALLRSEKVGSNQQYCSLLLTSVQSMLNEKGPTAFFDLNGVDSVSLNCPPTQQTSISSLVVSFHFCVNCIHLNFIQNN